MTKRALEETTSSRKPTDTGWARHLHDSTQRRHHSPHRSRLSPSPSPEPRSRRPDADVAAAVPETGGSSRRWWHVHQSFVDLEELVYPSSLHRAGRLMVTTLVMSRCLLHHAGWMVERLVQKLVDNIMVDVVFGGVMFSVK